MFRFIISLGVFLNWNKKAGWSILAPVRLLSAATRERSSMSVHPPWRFGI